MRKPRIETMEHPELDDKLREPLDEEERELVDTETWDWDNEMEGTSNPNPRMVFEVPLSLDELRQIEPAAIPNGMTVVAFLKDAALRSARVTLLKWRFPDEVGPSLATHPRSNPAITSPKASNVSRVQGLGVAR